MIIERTYESNGKVFDVVRAFEENYMFIVERPKSGKPAKIINEIVIVENILARENLTVFDRMQLLNIYNVAYHDSGKIEGIYSLDSSATNCGFCVKMREYAAKHPELNIVCGYCYDFKQETYRFSALNRHSLNMVIMNTVEFTVEELATLPAGYLVRVNSSGDSAGDIYAGNMIKFAIGHPSSRVAIWAKNAIGYIRAIDILGKPENVTMIFSSTFVDKPVKLPKYFDFTFTVYYSKNKIQVALANGAGECNGKKCKDCGYKCYLHGWKFGTNIAEFLRK